jgi:hypothetical protein
MLRGKPATSSYGQALDTDDLLRAVGPGQTNCEFGPLIAALADAFASSIRVTSSALNRTQRLTRRGSRGAHGGDHGGELPERYDHQCA